MDFKSIASDNTESGLLNSHTNSLSLSLSRPGVHQYIIYYEDDVAGDRFWHYPAGFRVMTKLSLFFFRLVSS